MILNYTHRIAFLHIPKCAGSSVKDQLRVLDETGGRFERAEPHPRFGRVHRAHLPLWLLRELYPDDFTAVTESASFAVLRDPVPRFASALAQRIEQFGKTDPFALPEDALRREVETVVTHLTDHPDSPVLEFCHFLRQRDFVDLEGRRVVSHLYRLEDVPALLAEISARSGQSVLAHAKSNEKLDFRLQGLKAPVLAVNAALRRMLPAAAHAALKERAKGLITRKGSKGPVWTQVLQRPEIRAFIDSYYREDAALLASVPARDAA